MLQNYQNQYQKVRIETASPGELTLILYEELYRKLNLSKKHLAMKDIEACGESIHGARSILNELSITLDMKYEISNQLFQLYDYYIRRLNQFAATKEVSYLDEAIEFAKGMVTTWKEALQIVKAGNQA